MSCIDSVESSSHSTWRLKEQPVTLHTCSSEQIKVSGTIIDPSFTQSCKSAGRSIGHSGTWTEPRVPVFPRAILSLPPSIQSMVPDTFFFFQGRLVGVVPHQDIIPVAPEQCILAAGAHKLIIPSALFEPIIASSSLDRDCARTRRLVLALTSRSVTT
jgi:hypothetical protein